MDKFLFMPADLTAGLEYNEDKLKDVMQGYNREFEQDVKIASAYLQNEWKNKTFGILIGGRVDYHNIMKKAIFSPRANLRYNPIEKINLRLSYSYGFRAAQAFEEDLHIGNVGGTVLMIRLADDLRVEKSQSLSLSADMYKNWCSWQCNFLVEGFFTDLSDIFTLIDIGMENGVLIKERGNEKGARVYGSNLEGKLAWKSIWQFQAGMTLQQSMYKEARAWSKEVDKEKRMFRTPNFYGYFTTTYQPIKPLTLSLSGIYTGSMLVEHYEGYIKSNKTVKTPQFFDLNLKTSYDFKFYKGIILQLNAGVQNIFNSYQKDFDKGPDRDGGYVYGPARPRAYFFGIKLTC